MPIQIRGKKISWNFSSVGQMSVEWRLYTFVDLQQGYFHIPVCEVLRRLLVFESNGRRYKYNSLPQGWESSYSALHSGMCSFLADTEAVVYVDDLLVGGKDQEEHDVNLGKVLA